MDLELPGKLNDIDLSWRNIRVLSRKYCLFISIPLAIGITILGKGLWWGIGTGLASFLILYSIGTEKSYHITGTEKGVKRQNGN